MIRRNLKTNKYDSDLDRSVWPGRFGFEVVPDDAPDLDDDDQSQAGRVLQTVLALMVIIALAYAVPRLYGKFEDVSWSKIFEIKIGEPDQEQLKRPAVVDESLLPGSEPAPAAERPELEPTKRLFNPDGTMKASFPLPPDGPPADYSQPEDGRAPIRRAQEGGSTFDPDQEAYDPAKAHASRRVSSEAPPRRAAAPSKSIGEYEVFDPEQEALKSDWEFFDDPRR